MSLETKLLDDFNFKFESLRKSELENIKHQSLKELLQNKETIIFFFNNIIKEYFARSKLEKEISNLCQQQASVSYILTELRKKLQSRKDEKQKREFEKEKTRNIVSFYEENLSLKVELASGIPISDKEAAVSFVFSNIDESNTQDTSSFILVTNGIRYKVINCHPPVEGMNEMLQKLNLSDDICDFIINMRKHFKKSLH